MGMVAHKSEAGGPQYVWGHPRLHSKFKASLSYKPRPCPRNQKRKEKLIYGLFSQSFALFLCAGDWTQGFMHVNHWFYHSAQLPSFMTKFESNEF